MTKIIEYLLAKFSDEQLAAAGVIPWSSPVPVFGNLAAACVATLGLNPSNREFVDQLGNELAGINRRFETLGSLKLRDWADASNQHLQKILATCQYYFSQNPYDAWFKKLDQLISATGASYYCGSAAHLDLVPYATSRKWSELTSDQRQTLFRASGPALVSLLRESPIRVLVLNGASVVSNFQLMFGITLEKTPMPSWSLRSNTEAPIKGYAYKGHFSVGREAPLNRRITVLGFNHNIQSSFGVTNTVTSSIAQWIGRMSEEALNAT